MGLVLRCSLAVKNCQNDFQFLTSCWPLSWPTWFCTWGDKLCHVTRATLEIWHVSLHGKGHMFDDIGNVTNVILSRTLSLRCHMRSQWRGVPSSRHPAAEKIKITNPQSWWSSLSDIAISTLQGVPEKRWTDFWGLCWQTRFLAKVAQTDLRGPKIRSSNKQTDRPQNCVYQLFRTPCSAWIIKPHILNSLRRLHWPIPTRLFVCNVYHASPEGSYFLIKALWSLCIFSYQNFVIIIHIFSSKLTTMFVLTHIIAS